MFLTDIYSQNARFKKNFTQEIDYKIITTKIVEEITKKKKNGGQNKKTIMLTVKCFKSLCLKAQTTKSFETRIFELLISLL